MHLHCIRIVSYQCQVRIRLVAYEKVDNDLGLLSAFSLFTDCQTRQCREGSVMAYEKVANDLGLLILLMLWQLSSKLKCCKDFRKPSIPCHVSIRQMSTHMPGFQSFSSFLFSVFSLFPTLYVCKKCPYQDCLADRVGVFEGSLGTTGRCCLTKSMCSLSLPQGASAQLQPLCY